MNHEIRLSLTDHEWPFEFTDHDREIVRAIVFDRFGFFYFVRSQRDDIFGKAATIETAGGGVEPGEDLYTAIQRELKEELGASVTVLCALGTVDDFYNLIHRHNINHYFLCKVNSFGARSLTKDETDLFHLSTLKLTFEDALQEYEACSNTKLGRLIANRELPILRYAAVLMSSLP